jgi:murein DD-endopeptidase MepM/ murein hydrolase activator NlpD
VPLQLPREVVSTHLTAGLPGFPAVDVFGSPGETVRAGFWGTVTRISGRSCAMGGRPGGAYGRSIYVHNAANGVTRYLTHFDQLFVKVGDKVKPGTPLGTICDGRNAGRAGSSHIHYGIKRV